MVVVKVMANQFENFSIGFACSPPIRTFQSGEKYAKIQPATMSRPPKLNNQPKLAITQLFAFVVMLIKLSLFVKLKIDAPINNRKGGQKTACLIFFKILPPFIKDSAYIFTSCNS